MFPRNKHGVLDLSVPALNDPMPMLDRKFSAETLHPSQGHVDILAMEIDDRKKINILDLSPRYCSS